MTKRKSYYLGTELKASDLGFKVEASFWSLVKIDLLGCWEWQGTHSKDSYGRFMVGTVRYTAHRISYALCFGSISVGDIICHKCDNPKCVRPDHLFVGTAMTNARDKVSKGRQARGETSGCAVLNDVSALAIFRSSKPSTELAKIYGVSPSLVRRIKLGHSWRHVTFGAMAKDN